MTERRRPRRPSPAPVVWASTVLFACLFALLTYNFSLGGDPSSSAAATPAPRLRKVIKRRVVTTIVPSPGADTVTAVPPAYSSSESGPVYESPPVTTSAS